MTPHKERDTSNAPRLAENREVVRALFYQLVGQKDNAN